MRRYFFVHHFVRYSAYCICLARFGANRGFALAALVLLVGLVLLVAWPGRKGGEK